jgi:hypothetical protein
LHDVFFLLIAQLRKIEAVFAFQVLFNSVRYAELRWMRVNGKEIE